MKSHDVALKILQETLKSLGLFLLIFGMFVYFYHSGYVTKKEQYIANKAERAYNHYRVTYKTLQDNTEHFYNSMLNNPQLILAMRLASSGIKADMEEAREAIDSIFGKKYKLIEKLGIDSMRLYLHDNRLLYSRSEPDRYGDTTSKLRDSVTIANRDKRAAEGLELGATHSAFRFVYPLFAHIDNNNTQAKSTIHIGSVEFSSSPAVFVKYLEKALHKHMHFLVNKQYIHALNPKKQLFDNHIQCNGLSNFLQLEEDVDIAQHHALEKIKNCSFDNAVEDIKKPFGFEIDQDDKPVLLLAIPIDDIKHQETIAMFVIYDHDNSLLQIRNEYIADMWMGLLLSILISILLYSILKSKERLSRDIKIKTDELYHLNQNLKLDMESEVKKSIEKDQQLIHQSRLAQMGEMIAMIAHQWRQPLAAISATSGAITVKAQRGNLDTDTAILLSKNISEYSQHMSATIDDFRDFFKTNKKREDCCYSDMLGSVLTIIGLSLLNKNIKLIEKQDSEDIFHTYQNEVKQVILNLIKNAEDILLEREIKNPKIVIVSRGNLLSISDNAGGVPEEIIDKIFNPYFSTKTKKDGTGLGLYMSKTIIEEHCNGELSMINGIEGAIFTIKL